MLNFQTQTGPSDTSISWSQRSVPVSAKNKSFSFKLLKTSILHRKESRSSRNCNSSSLIPKEAKNYLIIDRKYPQRHSSAEVILVWSESMVTEQPGSRVLKWAPHHNINNNT